MNSLIANFPPLLVNTLPLIGLALGLLAGWALNAVHHRRAGRRAAWREPGPELHMELSRDEKLDQMHAAEVELAQAEARLTHLNKTIAVTRQQLDDTEQEYDRLLVAFDERQSTVKETQSNLNSIRQNLDARRAERNRLLSDVDRSIEEQDMLRQMQEGYQVKINRLTQQVQWQDAELRMLRQTVKAKTAEIDEARALLDQRDAELRMLHRQRQQREIDIAHARQLITQKDDELRRQMGVARAVEALPAQAPPPLSLPPRRVDVTPAPSPRLPGTALAEEPAPPPARSPVEDDLEDDLTVIPRLSPYYANQLRGRGVKSLRQLAAMTPDQVRALLDIPGHHAPNIEGWIKAARKLTRKRRKEDGA
jgi:predicted flap endonuclease-1-like 5' DNA nuclease